MVDIKTIIAAMTRPGIEIEVRGDDRYMIHTGYTYPDGDELHIILKRSGDSWILTDDGHTMMWLSYEDFKLTNARETMLSKTLNTNGTMMKDGKIYVVCPEDSDKIAFALKSIVQTEIQVADLLFLDKNTVKNTFIEDLKEVFLNSDMSDKCRYDQVIIDKDNIGYHADVYIESKRPIVVFGIHTPMQCSRATIAMLSLDKEKYIFMTVIDSNGQIPKSDVKKAVNASIKTTYDLNDAVNGAKRLLSFT